MPDTKAFMSDPSMPLVFPQLGALYQTAAPVVEALLRVMVGLALLALGWLLRRRESSMP